MASITANGSKGHHKFTLEVVENSYSIDSNTSEVGFTFKLAPITSGYNWSGWGSYISYKVIINGTEYTGTIGSYNGSSTITLKNATQTIYHENDGSKTISFSFSVSDTTGASYTCGNASASGSLALTTIPRASTFTLSGGTIGSSISVSITRASSSFTHKVYCKYSSKTQTLSNSATTSASATLDMDFCNYITTSTTASGTMYVETYSGSTYIGTTSSQFIMTIPSSVVPTISSVSKSDTSNLLASYGAYVQSKSNLKVQTTASGSYSSTISSIVVNTKDSNGNIIRTLSGNNVTFNNVNYVGTATIQVIATDSRGRQATNTSTITIASYSNPVISSFTAERLNNDSTTTFTWNASITNINSANVNNKSFRIYRRQAGTSSWGSPIFSYSSAYTYTSSGSTYTCDADYGWEFKFEAQDSFTTSTFNITIGTAFELMNWKADGTALAIGKVSEHSNTFEINLATELNNKLDVTGNTTIGGDITASGKLEVGSVLSGTWTPILSNVNNVAPSVTYTYQNGYYFKLGNLIYIEFFVRGKITSLNSGDYACIRGIPYNANSSRDFGSQALSIGILYNAVTVETNNSFVVNGNLIRIQSTAGASATIWKVTSSGNFQIGGSGWYSI